MRIAIVAPSPNPFLVGGAENLWWGMLKYLNQETAHVADLIKLPVRESSLADLVAGYSSFSRLDLSGFDQVISTKYPAWMVAHPNHVVYLQHRCRGFYDWYPAGQLGGVDYAGDDPGILGLLAFLRRHDGKREALPEFFARFQAVAATPAGQLEFARHPGPAGRAIVRFLDGVGLAPARIRKFATIAKAVKRRTDYFPVEADVKVAYHPTNKTGFHDAGEEYFFTASRFYPSKRIELLIDAFRGTDIPLSFKIAGAGDEEATLRRHAGGDPRIEFVGFVLDDELVELYARAMAVAFAPADEDFGYITLEAMLAGKPVITTSDSGGPLELVRHEDTGIVAEPDAIALASAFTRVYREREWARAIGRRGLARAREVTWRRLFDTLVPDAAAPRFPRKRPPASRPRVTVINAYSVHPPDSGGRYRLHSLYKALSRHVDVDLVTLGLHEQGDDVLHVDDGLREIRVARTVAHKQADDAAHASAGVPVYDITALESIRLTPAYENMLGNSLAFSTAVVVSHPYMLEALRRTGYAGRFLYEGHNCELALKAGMLPESAARARLLRLVEQAEGACCREAALTFATSSDDAEGLLRQYGGPRDDMIVVPNGTDPRRIPFRSSRHRRTLKRRMGISDRPMALFLASGHGPNLQSAERLFALAQTMPEVSFALVGSVADAFVHRSLPRNVWLVGMVSEDVRNLWLEAADVALNPVLHGGGTNLKLLDYFAAGTPVVSTELGTRGTGIQAGRHAAVAAIDGFGEAIRSIAAGGPQVEQMVAEARRLVEAEFDWQALADNLHRAMLSRGLVAEAVVVQGS